MLLSNIAPFYHKLTLPSLGLKVCIKVMSVFQPDHKDLERSLDVTYCQSSYFAGLKYLYKNNFVIRRKHRKHFFAVAKNQGLIFSSHMMTHNSYVRIPADYFFWFPWTKRTYMVYKHIASFACVH